MKKFLLITFVIIFVALGGKADATHNICHYEDTCPPCGGQWCNGNCYSCSSGNLCCPSSGSAQFCCSDGKRCNSDGTCSTIYHWTEYQDSCEAPVCPSSVCGGYSGDYSNYLDTRFYTLGCTGSCYPFNNGDCKYSNYENCPGGCSGGSCVACPSSACQNQYKLFNPDCTGSSCYSANDGTSTGCRYSSYESCPGGCSGGSCNCVPTTEVCDGIDNNCDTGIDEGVTTTYYADADGDTFGDSDVTTEACSAPPNYVTDNTDCDDNVKSCTTDCTSLKYQDLDEDGHGNPDVSVRACDAPAGYVIDNTDCDDRPDGADGIPNNADDGKNIYFGAIEICDGVNNNCDAITDEGCDDDNDDFCDSSMTRADPYSCDDSGSDVKYCCSSGSGDCVDNDNDINPDATDVCDGVNNDCDANTADGSAETTPLCTNQDGVCEGSVKTCGGVSGWSDCTAADYGSDYELTESSCSDGLDNDCDLGQPSGGVDGVDSDCEPDSAKAVCEAQSFTWIDAGESGVGEYDSSDSPVQVETMKVYPVADAYVRSDFKSYKAGGIHYFIIGRFSGTGYGYIKFDIPAISGIVTSAKLNIYEYAFWFWESPPGASRLWAVDVPFNIHKVTGSWSEYGINWNNKPGFDGTLATIINSQDSYELVQGYMVDKTPTADWMVADLPVSLIEEWGTGSNNGLVIERTGPAAWSFTYAKEYWVSNLRPFLEISYNVPTSTQACCGDDSSENHVTSTGYGSDSTSACCTHDTDCVLSSKCYSDGDVTGSLRCEGGSWEDSCIDNDGDGYGDPGNKDCAKGIETDCNDGDANINPGINENTGDLCSDGIDNNCNQDNNVAWDDVSTTGVDCKDLGCAGKTGLANVCCQSVTDCSSVVEGNCGAKSCSSNECIVTVDSDTSTRCSGLTVGWCGISAGTCSAVGAGFECDITGDNTQCDSCDYFCDGSPNYNCNLLPSYCDNVIYSVCTDTNLAPSDKNLCVCYGYYSPSSGCDTDYPNTGSTSVGGGIC